MKFKLRTKKNLLFKVGLALFVLYIIFLLVSLFMKLQGKKAEVNEIDGQIAVEKSRNEEISGKLAEESSGENSESQVEAPQGNVRVYENVVR